MIAPSLVAALLLAQSGSPPIVTLDDALREARQKNLDIQQAEARLRQAQQASAKAWSAYLPQVTAQGSFTYNDPAARFVLPAGTFGPDETTVTITPWEQLGAQAEARQALIAPALWPTIASAYTGERVAALGTENVLREVLFGVAQAYYGAASLKQLVAVAEGQLALTREREKDARVRFQAGAAPKVALLRAEIDRAQAEQDLKRAQNSYGSARLALGTLLGRSDDFEVDIPPRQMTPEGDLEATALRERPDVLAAAASVQLARERRSATWLRYAPSLGAFAQYRWANFSGFSGQSTSFAGGVALSWNLFDGGLREAEIREADARVVEAQASRQSTEVKAIEEVRRARLDLESALANKAKASERLALAQENERLVSVSYKAGAATYLESADATEALRLAQIGLVTDSLSAELAALRLLKAAGSFRQLAR